MKRLIYLLAALALSAQAGERMRLIRPAEYPGMCDASAGVAVTSNLFLVASDENNSLRLYRTEEPGPPLEQFNLDAFLEIRGKSPEADLEAAARIGNRVFWMGSHGRNKNAKQRENRCRFFATDIRWSAVGRIVIAPVGRPYKQLLLDLTTDPRLRKFRLDLADEKAPKDEEGLNIEGLSATPEGHLLIGFRNPIPDDKALIVPLLNPNEVVTGTQRAQLGAPFQLDLGGLGVRDMVFYSSTYLIIAGSYHGGGKFRIYRWDGSANSPEPLGVEGGFNRYNPEALILYPEKGLREFQVLSDDGERLIDGIPGKQLKNPARRKFRSFWLQAEQG